MNLLVVDVAIAAAVAVLILVLTPGLAISGVVGLVVLLGLGLTWLIGRWRGRSARYHAAGSHRRARPPGRLPPRR